MKAKDKASVSCGVLWDLDGVIADTNELHLESWREVLPDYGLKMTDEDHEKTFGMNNQAILTILMGAEPEADLLQEISDRKESAFRDFAREQVVPMAGVVAWLQNFKRWGFRQAIASSAPLENINALVDGMGLGEYIAVRVSGFGLPAKPDPAVYLEAAAQIDVLPERCLVIEDAVVGVEGAKNAGMTAIGVTTTHPADALKKADIVVGSLEDLDQDAVNALVFRR